MPGDGGGTATLVARMNQIRDYASLTLLCEPSQNWPSRLNFSDTKFIKTLNTCGNFYEAAQLNGKRKEKTKKLCI